ncbi:hypothetical protein P12x_003071 [Tundrisphaera lichenicola]|uniref:hypothetical protein n=1 Tax=Tundrisphaera lichenicola TaxID=2029860 RepID=UPI003EBDA8F8
MPFAKPFAASLIALAVAGSAIAQKATPNGPRHDGAEVATDLPPEIRVRNTVGTDGAGLCVWASTEMMARYLNVEGLVGIFEALQSEPGGGWPERVDREMQKRAPGVKYRQYLGGDLDFIREGIDSGRPVCVTYGYGEFYGSRTIAHMVLCVAMDDRYTGILDNNDPEHIWWMSTDEFRKRFGWPSGQGWAWYTLAPPPPPPPHN